MAIRIGTAGWAIPRRNADEFPKEGTSLERYATRFTCAEINSSFHRPHRSSTWERWRDSVPEDFRFSVKLPKTITHAAKLRDCGDLIDQFLASAHLLSGKLGVLLVQLPPKLEFEAAIASSFFVELSARTDTLVACEPRNPSWFRDDANALLAECKVARVAADPPVCEEAARPGGWPRLRYWRLHGSPEVYRSSYGGRIGDYARLLRDHASRADEAWCIFDNTASSAATGDALALSEALGGG